MPVYSIAILSLFVVFRNCTYNVLIYSLSASDYIYTAFLFKLTTDGLDPLEPPSYT